MMPTRRHLSIRLLVLAAAAGMAAPALAQERYPSRTVTLIVPQAPGGANDAIARIVAQKLSERFGQQFVVDNRPGAGGNIGTAAAAKARNDGYTLMLTVNSAHVINPALYRRPVSTRSRTSSPSPRWPRPAMCWWRTTASRRPTSRNW